MRPSPELDLVLKLGPSFDGDLDEAADSYRFRKDADEWDIIERVGEELGIQFTYRVDELDEVVLRPLLDDFEEWLRRGKPGRPALEASVDRLLEGASLPSVSRSPSRSASTNAGFRTPSG